MQLTELQIGLIALGVAGIGAVVGYNMWQEKRHRQTAERALGETHADVLIDPPDAPPRRLEPTLDFDLSDDAAPMSDPSATQPVRRDEPAPMLADEPVTDITEPLTSFAAEQTVAGWTDAAPAAAAIDERAGAAVDGWADAQVEELITIEFEAPVAATEFQRTWNDLTQTLAVTMRLRGRDEHAGRWLPLTAQTAGALSKVELAVQLADRRGALSEASVSALAHALQGVADRFLAVVHFPDVRELLGRARELDSFAASVDVQIGLNLVAGESLISGTKLRGLAEAQGFTLSGGQFHARDDVGNTLYTLCSLDAEQFSADTMKALQTQGVTLLLDVPTVADGARQFDRMVMVAEQFAHTLGAKVVDDNRQPLSPASLALIRGKVAEFQARMVQFGIKPGSESANRLFS
ncbi:cell division protein ZipA C-terminal FtsZ-binding domain-containing protein [Methyloversatilis sp. XJ19-49]|uniref:cell division protein ZipA C-terminal FtsZ-binding domain-containing protein n=1 Tax=Methyloversatilis sp. XJ19-49 TaxID=2963429 RepID=UPI00211CF0FA|nr:cell division protein ZipA C-terminal FtsZ-binding domain-containing protein [Methyloversatilis sp. XJ19-49]MCQ9379491.1 cell division protein ZipA C-terminal FtsZ-binding domain-containing protein [Methyloversatilis sp. XJ19-49]